MQPILWQIGSLLPLLLLSRHEEDLGRIVDERRGRMGGQLVIVIYWKG